MRSFRTSRGAAESLGAMLNYGKSAQAQARISVIIKAVEILAQRGVQKREFAISAGRAEIHPEGATA